MDKLKIRIIAIVFLMLWGAWSMAQSPQEIFVSPEGKDSWSGTVKKPYRTLQRAQEAVRSLKQATDDDITVYLRGGAYPLEQTWTFTPEDGGKAGQAITYEAYRQERVFVHGGQELKGWKADEENRL